MPGTVILRAWSPPGQIGAGGGFQVLTSPPLSQFCQRFWRGNARDPLAKALGFASMSAAVLEWDLVDETGTVPADMCAALVAEQARKRGASVTPITVAMQRRADRAQGRKFR